MERQSARAVGAVACLGLGLLALAVRAFGYFEIFPADGSVVLSIADGAYHLRRALFSFELFPAALFFDPLLNHPDGAPVPMPPLYDWALGGIARLFTDTQPGFERVAAWASPVLAALTVWPIYATGRALRGPGTGLLAGLIFALLPIHVNFSRLGEPDHHAAVALLGACWLWAIVAVLGAPGQTRARMLHGVLALVRAAMLLTWSGSLLYLALFEAALLGVAAVAGRREVLIGQAWGAGVAALLVAPVVALTPVPIGGALTATTLSWLHVIVLVAVGALAGIVAIAEARRPAAGPAGRALRVVLIGAALAAPLLALGPVRDALLPGLDFVARDDGWGAGSVEQRPLFARSQVARRAPRDATQLYGGFAFLIPLVGVGALLRARRARTPEPGVALAIVASALGILALLQVRFGNDFLPAGALGFALLAGEISDGLASRLGGQARARTLVGLALLALLWPPLVREHLPALQRARAFAALPNREKLPPSPSASLHGFARIIAAVTPDTPGFLDPDARPAYGVLCPPNFGHVIHASARRATPADNFGPYLDPAKLAAVTRFYNTRREDDALRIARRLETRYVMTADLPGGGPLRWAQRLHHDAGSAGETQPHAEHFRWIADGPPGGRPLRFLSPAWKPGDAVPYRLFEVVEGAVLEAPAAPGTAITATLSLVTGTGARHLWRARGVAGADGIARLRVPHPTRSRTPVHAAGPYRVEVGGRVLRATVSEAAVREGARVLLAPPPPG